MKKISLIAAAIFASMSLAACGNSSSHKTTKQASSSSKVVHHKHHKKQQHKKKAASSSSNSVSSSVSSSSNNQQQAQQGQQTQQSQNGNGQLPPASDLHDFVNRYGESPAAYLMDHEGMSQTQALNSVPMNMKTSGEIQDTYAETGQQ